MLYAKKSVLYYATVLSLMLAPACQCKKDTTQPSKPEEIPKDSRLVTSIRINNVPKDSLVYNDQQQVTERWDYSTYKRQWQNYTTYTYNGGGYVTMAKYYNENDNTSKSLSQKDSVVWQASKLFIYTTKYREMGTVVATRDTTTLALNSNNQLTLLGTKDTLSFLPYLNNKFVLYIDYQYTGNNIRSFNFMSYNIMIGNAASEAIYKDNFEMQYNQTRNPLYKLVAKNPILFRTLIGENFPGTSNQYFPFLGSERYVTNIKYQSEAIPLTNVPVTYKMVDTTNYAQTQTFTGLNMVISYGYKNVKLN